MAKFVVIDPGDRSVGIWPYHAIIEVTVRDQTARSRNRKRRLTPEETQALKDSLKEVFTECGGVCMTEKEYEAHERQEARLEKKMEVIYALAEAEEEKLNKRARG